MLSGLTDVKNLSHNQSKSSKYSNMLMKNLKNVPTISPVSTPSNGERFRRTNVRRASMPIVLVNGKKEFHKKQLKLLPEDETSDKGIMFEASGEDHVRRSHQIPPNTLHTSASIEEKLETIVVISPNGIPPDQKTKREALTKEKLLSMEESEEDEDRMWG